MPTMVALAIASDSKVGIMTTIDFQCRHVSTDTAIYLCHILDIYVNDRIPGWDVDDI